MYPTVDIDFRLRTHGYWLYLDDKLLRLNYSIVDANMSGKRITEKRVFELKNSNAEDGEISIRSMEHHFAVPHARLDDNDSSLRSPRLHPRHGSGSTHDHTPGESLTAHRSHTLTGSESTRHDRWCHSLIPARSEIPHTGVHAAHGPASGHLPAIHPPITTLTLTELLSPSAEAGFITELHRNHGQITLKMTLVEMPFSVLHRVVNILYQKHLRTPQLVLLFRRLII